MIAPSTLSQHLGRRRVARLERPVGEADEVGEDDRQLGLAALAPAARGERLVDLQGPEAELPQDARAVGADLRDPAAELWEA